MSRRYLRIAGWVGGLVAALVGGAAAGEGPGAAYAPAEEEIPPRPPAVHVHRRGGPLRRAAAHVGRNLFGVPEAYDEPPLGAFRNQSIGAMEAKAAIHAFTFYRSDFLPGTAAFSPSGQARFHRVLARCPSWPGPVVVEWTPETPALAEVRRATLAGLLASSGTPTAAERVVVGPPAARGLSGTEADAAYQNSISRYGAGGTTLEPPPNFTGQQAGQSQ
jgi:hypothetical protein